MKGITPEGKCPKCGSTFKWDGKLSAFRCPEHYTTPQRFRITVYYKGERITRCTSLEGKTIRNIGDAFALYRTAENEKEGKRFDPDKWRSKSKIEYTFSVLIDQWYREKEDKMKQGRLAPSYLPKLWQYIRLYYQPSFMWNMDVREIRTMHIRELARGVDKSAKYTKNIIEALRSFFNWLKYMDILSDLPKFQTDEVPEYVPTTISREIQTQILDKIPDEHKPIFTWLFYQGARPSEVRALKWKDIEGDTVTIRRTWSDHVLVERTKTKRIRVNLIFPEVLDMLPPRRFPEDFLFQHGIKIKRPYSKTFLNDLFQDACNELGLKLKLYEATKHSFGTQLVNEGVGIDKLRGWFGHSTDKMTERYAKLNVVNEFRKIRRIGDDR